MIESITNTCPPPARQCQSLAGGSLRLGVSRRGKIKIENAAKLLGVIVAIALFAFVPKANAQTFIGRDLLKDFANTPNTQILKNDQITGDTSASIYCQQNLFKFQTNNLFVGTFCDLGSILAISSADFATNVTCTIQKVAMSNYDSSIEFNTSAAGTCTASHDTTGATGLLGNTGGQEIFGKGNATNTNPDGSQADGTGLYKSGAMSQLSNDITGNTWIYNSFKIVRNFATVIALVFLMIFAFANILHFDVNTYTIKKMIPNIIIAVVGAYLAIYAIMLVSRGIDFLYRLEFFSPYNALNPFYNIMGGNFNAVGLITTGTNSGVAQAQNAMSLIFNLGGQLLGAGNSGVSILGGILGVILLSIPAVVVFAFEYVMALRPLAVGLLVVLSPVAFSAYIFPTGQNIFKKWVTITFIALFYAPAVNLILYIVNQIPGPSTSLMFILMLLVKTAVFVLLIRLPFTIETDIQKISLALAKTSFGGALGFGKAGDQNIKVKQNNRGTITDQTLGTKAAKSLIAPINSTYRHDITNDKIETSQKRQIMSQIFNRNQGPYVRNLDKISDKAHQNNSTRGTNLLVSAVADLSPQAFGKILTSSNRSIFKDTPLINELKLKNGQLLDDEGAVTRADAVKKVFRSAQLVDQGKIGNPEAVKLLSQKQMLSALPLEILKKSLDQGIISKDDIRTNFKGNVDSALSRINEFSRGKMLNNQELQAQTTTDYQDSKLGFTDLIQAMRSNPGANSTSMTRTVETLKNQNQGSFDQSSLYYLSRLSEINKATKEHLATNLQQAGTPAQTAIAISHNPALNYEQIASYVPKTATPEALSVIREAIAERDNSQTMIKQISSSLQEDKTMLGRTIAEKVSESLKTGNSHSFDDIKNQLSTSLKNLSSNANPEEVKSALAQLNSFAPGTAMQTATTATAEDIDKIKAKGEAVLSTIDEMKMAGVDEKAVMQNPQAAAQQYSTQVQKTINSVATGKQKPGDVLPAQPAASQNTSDLEKIAPNTDQVAQVIGTVISSKAEKGKTFEQTVSDLSKPQQGSTPAQSTSAPTTEPGAVKNG